MASNILRNALAYKDSHRQDALMRNKLAAFRTDQAEQERVNMLGRNVGTRVAEGDLAGARTTALQAGNLDLAGKVAGIMEKQSEAERLDFQRGLTTAAILKESGVQGDAFNTAMLDLGFDEEDIQGVGNVPPEALRGMALGAKEFLKQGQEKVGPIQEIYDPDSPTGTRFVTRQEAIGQPGKPASGQEISVGPDGAVNIRSGRLSQATTQPTTKPTTNKLQQSLGSLEESIARVQDIENRYQDGFLTVGGRIRNLRSRLQDKADIPGLELSREDREFLKKRKQFEFLVDRDFNAYRKEITGAAASMQELERLKKAMLNTDLSPAEFEATLEIYQDELMRAMRIKRRLLREGITVGDKGFGDAYDRLYLNGADDDINTRGKELLASGMDMEAATKQLVTEGYISPSGAPE